MLNIILETLVRFPRKCKKSFHANAKMRGANKARGKIIGGTIGAKAANADFLRESAENCGASQPVREEEEEERQK